MPSGLEENIPTYNYTFACRLGQALGYLAWQKPLKSPMRTQ